MFGDNVFFSKRIGPIFIDKTIQSPTYVLSFREANNRCCSIRLKIQTRSKTIIQIEESSNLSNNIYRLNQNPMNLKIKKH